MCWSGRYSLHTPGCRVLEKLTGLQLVKKFPAFHGTRRFITALTSVRHLSLSWTSPIQSIYPHPTSWRYILILSTHLRLGLPSGLLHSGFPSKTLYTPSLHLYLYTTHIPSYLPLDILYLLRNFRCLFSSFVFIHSLYIPSFVLSCARNNGCVLRTWKKTHTIYNIKYSGTVNDTLWYSMINSTKSPALGAGNISGPRLMLQVERVR